MLANDGLYIPLRSDKTVEILRHRLAIYVFISHYVQIKLNVFNQYLRTIHLYIPLRSDKTQTYLFSNCVLVKNFISHYIQIKHILTCLTHDSVTCFISLPLQIKKVS